MMVFVTYSQQGEIKGVLPFYPAHSVQKSVLDVYMIWQKKCIYYNRRGVSRYATLITLCSPSKTCHLDQFRESQVSVSDDVFEYNWFT